MAKLEIEERAWSDPRLKTVARRLKAGRGEVLGWLCGIWHDSQQLGMESASADEIDAWMEVGRKYRAPDIRAALAEEGYLELLQCGSYRIDGNSWRIKRTQARVKNAKAAITARWNKDENTTRIPPVSESYNDSNRVRIPDRDITRQVYKKTERRGDARAQTHARVDPPPAEQDRPAASPADAGPRLSPSKLVEIWNNEGAGLKVCQTLSKGREAAARARIAEHPDPEFWRGVVRRMAASPFCRGSNDRGWKADIDFLLRRDTYARVLEGKYDDNATNGAGGGIDWDRVFSGEAANDR